LSRSETGPASEPTVNKTDSQPTCHPDFPESSTASAALFRLSAKPVAFNGTTLNPMSAGGPSRSLEITMPMLFQQLPMLNVSDFCLSGHFVYFGGFASTIAIQGIWTHPPTLLITIAILDIGVIS